MDIVTPSVRIEGLALVNKALRRQTYKNFTWYIVSPEPRSAIKKYVTLPFIHARDPLKGKGDVWSFNKAMNKALALGNNPLIISIQDYTFFKPDAMEKFLFHFQQEPQTLVSGVGGKYQDYTWQIKTWADPRERSDQGSYYSCYPNDWEGNFAAVPRAAIKAIGGFIPEMDKFYGLDWFSVNQRIEETGGWDFKLDQTNVSYSLEHGRLTTDWDKLNWMADGRYDKFKMKLRSQGRWPKYHLKSDPEAGI